MDNVVSLADDFKREFKRLRKKYSSLDDDLARFIARLHENPFLGVSLGGGLRKVRFPISSKGRGKSGGGRVITHNVIASTQGANVKLLTIYDKSDKANIKPSELRAILKEEGLL